jgi:hypothetical protein
MHWDIPTLRELPPSLLAGRMALCSSLLVRSVHQRGSTTGCPLLRTAHSLMHARARVRGAGSACIEAQYPETSALLVRCAVLSMREYI